MPSDQMLKCVGCGKEFLWSASEQKFFHERQFTQPKRCKLCREIRRAKAADPGLHHEHAQRQHRR